MILNVKDCVDIAIITLHKKVTELNVTNKRLLKAYDIKLQRRFEPLTQISPHMIIE